MEAMVWLFFEIGGLLALAGIAFFALGWWAKGKTGEIVQSKPSAPVAAPQAAPTLVDLAHEAERQHWEKQIFELRSERDGLLNEIGQLKSRPEAPAPKPTKPRPRKSKK